MKSSNNKADNIPASSLKSKKYNFDDPIQRGEDQWDSMQKTKLIDSLLRGIPVDPARAIKSEYDENGNLVTHPKGGVIIDGKQRLTTIIAYLKDEFALDEKYLLAKENEEAGPFKDGDDKTYTLYDLTYDINAKEEDERVAKAQKEENERVEKYNEAHKDKKNFVAKEAKTINRKETTEKLVGMKFSQLPEGLQDKLKNVQVPVYTLEEVTPWEKNELFKRQNNGKPLTKAQMNNAEYTPESYEVIKKITSIEGAHYEWTEVSKNRAGEVKKDKNGNDVVRTKTMDLPNIWHRQLSSTIFKSGEDRQIVLQTLMLIDNYNDGDFGFENDTDIRGFIAKFNGMDEVARAELVEKVCIAAREFNTALDRKPKNIVNLKKTSVSMLVAGMNLVLAEGKDPKQYIENVRAFFDRYNEKDEDGNTRDDDIAKYKGTITGASASKGNVSRRWDVFKGFVENTPAKAEA